MTTSILKERLQRENNTFNNSVIDLDDVKQILIQNTLDTGGKFTLTYFIENNFTTNLYEKYAYYLHSLIIFDTHDSVHKFLKYHFNNYGQYATELFVNYPLVSMIDKNIITPLMCAMLWTNNPQMIRVLYYWGADVSLHDVNGKYPEEKYGSYYVNHLNPFIGRDHFILGIRNNHNFLLVNSELRYIAENDPPPLNWKPPQRAHSYLTESISQQTSTYNTNQHT
jgi:hypothetical protein